MSEQKIAIVGSGVVAKIFALLLSRSQFSFCLSSNTSLPAKSPAVIALTPASVDVLKHIAVWPRIASSAIGRFRQIKAWESGVPICFQHHDIRRSTLGYTVMQGALLEALDAALATLPYDSLPSSIPEALASTREHILLQFAGGKTHRSALVVAADGSRSPTRALAGIAWHAKDYQQSTVVTCITTERAHGCVARQRFLTTGPVALLPMAASHQVAVIWSTSRNEARFLLDLPKDQFHSILAKRIEYCLGAITNSEARHIFPLYGGYAERYFKDRTVLLGDAAHRVHPLAGQGMNLGIMDAVALLKAVQLAGLKRRDVGEQHTLRRYERWRFEQNYWMMQLFDGLNSLFSSRSRTISLLRNKGLILVDALAPLKRLLTLHASGLHEDSPIMRFNTKEYENKP